MICLKTLAKDNTGRLYEVSVDREFKYSDGQLVLKFSGAPSGWYLKTLLKEHRHHELSIQGNEWLCVNIQEILDEIKSLFGIKE